MRFRVTSVASEGAGHLLNEATVRIEDWLNACLADGNFGDGVDQFMIVAVSVDDDDNENARWSQAHDTTGKRKNQFTGESVRFISSAVPLPYSSVTSMAKADLLSHLCVGIIERLKVRPKRVPKGFDYSRCSAAVSKALAVYVEPVAS